MGFKWLHRLLGFLEERAKAQLEADPVYMAAVQEVLRRDAAAAQRALERGKVVQDALRDVELRKAHWALYRFVRQQLHERQRFRCKVERRRIQRGR